MKLKITLTDIDFLLFFLPAANCFMFWLNTFTGNNIQIGSYFDLLITFYLYKIAFKQYRPIVFLSAFLIVFISLAYVFLLGTTINACFSYITILNNLIFSLWLFPKLDFSTISVQKVRRHLLIFVSIFIIVYEISVPYAKKRLVDDIYNDVHRVYKDGFVICHVAAYYLGVAGYFLFLLRRKIIAVLLWLYVLTLGARIAAVYALVAVIVLCISIFPKFYRSLFKYRYLLLLSIVICFTMATFYALKKIGIEGLVVFTSGRTVFWVDGLLEIYRDGYGLLNVLGRGPEYSIIFNKEHVGIPVWMHNDYLDIVFNLGIVGLSAYLFAFYNYFRKIKSLYLLLAFVFAAFFNGFLYYDPLFVILLSTMFAEI